MGQPANKFVVNRDGMKADTNPFHVFKPCATLGGIISLEGGS